MVSQLPASLIFLRPFQICFLGQLQLPLANTVCVSARGERVEAGLWGAGNAVGRQPPPSQMRLWRTHWRSWRAPHRHPVADGSVAASRSDAQGPQTGAAASSAGQVWRDARPWTPSTGQRQDILGPWDLVSSRFGLSPCTAQRPPHPPGGRGCWSGSSPPRTQHA